MLAQFGQVSNEDGCVNCWCDHSRREHRLSGHAPGFAYVGAQCRRRGCGTPPLGGDRRGVSVSIDWDVKADRRDCIVGLALAVVVEGAHGAASLRHSSERDLRHDCVPNLLESPRTAPHLVAVERDCGAMRT
jgi:hypothetical protein